MKSNKRIVLAYSGGLDTSIILKWLQENYKAEVIAYTADIGQKIDKKKITKNAKRLGVKKIIINDLKNTFVKDYVYPMIRGHAIYEGVYLLGTSIARPLIAKDQIKIAKKFKAYAVSHGSTGKGNDQVRFELGYHYFGPKIKIIAPWRIWKLKSRTDLINYAKKFSIPIPKDKKGNPPFSIDDNLFHTSTEGKVLENPINGDFLYNDDFLISPNISPVFEWNHTSTLPIIGWAIELDNRDSFDSNNLRSFNSWNDIGFDLTNLTFSIPNGQNQLEVGEEYYWRVRALSSTNQLGDWSQPSYFAIPDLSINQLSTDRFSVVLHLEMTPHRGAHPDPHQALDRLEQ